MRVDAEIADRVLGYRSIALQAGALVLVEDLTETRRRELELRVKETTIREVHHRVKNNLQTIASLLRIQARGSRNEEVRRALAEATERVMSMAVVHELLTGSADERVDFAAAARTVVDLVRRGLDRRAAAHHDHGERRHRRARRSGGDVAGTGRRRARAQRHRARLRPGRRRRRGRGDAPRVGGPRRRRARRRQGLPPEFDAAGSGHLGLDIVRTVIEDDLRGTLTFVSERGTTVTIRAPLSEDEP